MITRPVLWDIERGRELWDAGVPVSQCARTVGTNISSFLMQAYKHKWPKREIGQPRLHTCATCRTPNAAVRKDRNCPDCQILIRETVARKRRPTKAQLRKTRTPQLPRDLDIELYRAEKATRKEYGPATSAAQICFEVAAQLRAEQPRRGRPKTDYGKRNRAA